jgi:hypothetical protein
MFLAGKANIISTPDLRKRRTMNDIIYTNPLFAKRIIDYFSPQFKDNDIFHEPCFGVGSFFDNMPEPKDFSEIELDKDFLQYDKPINWVLTNFPWSGKAFRPMLRHACLLSDNVVHLIRMHNAIGTTARHKDYLDAGHTIKEIITCDWKEAFVNKSPEGFSLVIIHLQKNYTGDCRWTHW